MSSARETQQHLHARRNSRRSRRPARAPPLGAETSVASAFRRPADALPRCGAHPEVDLKIPAAATRYWSSRRAHYVSPYDRFVGGPLFFGTCHRPLRPLARQKCTRVMSVRRPMPVNRRFIIRFLDARPRAGRRAGGGSGGSALLPLPESTVARSLGRRLVGPWSTF